MKLVFKINYVQRFVLVPLSLHLNGLDPEEYPRLPQLEEDLVFRLPQDMLKNIIRQTVFAVSTQETRPVLTGVNLEIENRRVDLYCNR